MNHLRLDNSQPDRITLWIDVAGRSVNVLSEPVFDELRACLAEATQLATDLPVVLRSSKPKCFVVGADLRRIVTMQTDEQIQTFLRYGQDCLETLERWDGNTVAVIEGDCLGGGLELALACRYRIARDTPQTRLGMPEAQLGLMPGWGGTQRLREIVGLEAALQMLLTGEPVDARQAFQMGLVDAISDPSLEEEALSRFLQSLPAGPQRMHETNSAAREQFDRWKRSQTGAFSSAQLAIIEAVATGIHESREAGFRAERTLFFPLLSSPAAREKLHRFAGPTPRSEGTQ